jgi:hypothetical protein
MELSLSERVHGIFASCEDDPGPVLQDFLETHGLAVNVNLYRGTGGRQALHIAAYEGHAACVRMLLEHGADVHASDDDGLTALMCSCIEGDNAECLQILIEAKSDVQAVGVLGDTPAHHAAQGSYECLKLLIENNADVNACAGNTHATPAMVTCFKNNLSCLQLLVDGKADLTLRTDDNQDILHYTIWSNAITLSAPIAPFTILCTNTDVQNVEMDEEKDVTQTDLDNYIEEYIKVQDYIDEFHGILKHTLSVEVDVDPRVGRRGGKGIYQEPMERVLEYMGLSMNADQVVNASIDGEEPGCIKRALIPFHVLSAKLWFRKHFN